ncbi:SURF1 family protein [Novosphingobium sp. SL115]|uniref:SURF1 family protein n=1 Tax=Novosphingobium sp. SL115 TaxID=2995150 RepID=UPI002273FC87|nr:SURF1 family protein [Novosphingobium sp. SL115]MCY1672641.1 SURF1 family protein [Novosphingobium sp. SL115]
MTPSGATRAKPVALVLALALIALLFTALAAWQVQRMQWKHALIARVEAGMVAAPVAVSALPEDDLAGWEYRRVQLSGHYAAQGTVLVSGASKLGSGYWVLAPLAGPPGTIYVNRGFMPLGTKLADVRAAMPAGGITVIGLLRLSEPGGGFLRSNRPAEERWYSRDVGAIAATHGIAADARFFVDASAETPQQPGAPVAGLTVVNFPDNHLVYALTWLALALLSGGAAIVLWRKAR